MAVIVCDDPGHAGRQGQPGWAAQLGTTSGDPSGYRCGACTAAAQADAATVAALGPVRSLPAPGAVWPVPAGADQWGPWQTVIADTGPAPALLLAVALENPTGTASAATHLRLAVAGDTPARLGSWRLGRIPAGSTTHLPAGYPLPVPAGAALAAAVATATGGTLNLSIGFVIPAAIR